MASGRKQISFRRNLDEEEDDDLYLERRRAKGSRGTKEGREGGEKRRRGVVERRRGREYEEEEDEEEEGDAWQEEPLAAEAKVSRSRKGGEKLGGEYDGVADERRLREKGTREIGQRRVAKREAERWQDDRLGDEEEDEKHRGHERRRVTEEEPRERARGGVERHAKLRGGERYVDEGRADEERRGRAKEEVNGRGEVPKARPKDLSSGAKRQREEEEERKRRGDRDSMRGRRGEEGFEEEGMEEEEEAREEERRKKKRMGSQSVEERREARRLSEQRERKDSEKREGEKRGGEKKGEGKGKERKDEKKEEGDGGEEMDEEKRFETEMEKRRRRVQEWQELKRKKEEEERKQNEKGGGEAKASKQWTLDGDDSDEDEENEAGDGDGDDDEAGRERGSEEADGKSEKLAAEDEMVGNKSVEASGSANGKKEEGSEAEDEKNDGGGVQKMEADDDVDPLDAFMDAFVMPEVKKFEAREKTEGKAKETKVKAEEEASDKPKPNEGSSASGAGAAAAAASGDAAAAASSDAAAAAAVAVKQEPLEEVKKEAKETLPKKVGFGVSKVRPMGFPAVLGGGAAAVRKQPPKIQKGPVIMGAAFGFDDDEEDAAREGDEEEEEEEEAEEGAELKDEKDSDFVKRVATQTKADKLPPVDHCKIDYMPFRKNLYTEVKEIARVSAEEVAKYRAEHEFKIRGKDVPKPVRTWHQTGISSKLLDVIKKLGFEAPMPIQAQAMPIIMSGRDCIGIAKTGSGKTLAFVLPMLRHIMDQPPLESGDGPIALILAPTRELVQQIHNDIKKFSKALGLHSVPVYGGSGVAQQIGELKRGTEIVVCTPGRMIDILCTSNGKITNLRRVTYLVMDEADRMFDMGFEPQIAKLVQNTRPDRQTVLFSATFPRQVETLARKVLTRPVEIQVGGRSVVNKDITQTVEVRPDGNERFLRLLELLGEWYEKGKILVFVHSQDKCDSLFRDMLKHGYPCLSLHGGKDQTDRESTIVDFKANVCNLLIATSVAARGLDVKELELVVNYDVPNHYEDYVHRVGRTGRAGKKGFAVTFLSPEDERFAPDLVRALELSEQPIPEDLKKMADEFQAKVKAGSVMSHGSGYGGSGFKFDEEEEEARKALKKAQAKEYGFEEEEEKSDEEGEDDGIRKVQGPMGAGSIAAAVAAAAAAAATKTPVSQISASAAAGSVGPAGVPALAPVNQIQAAIHARMAQMGIPSPAGATPAAPSPSILPTPAVPGAGILPSVSAGLIPAPAAAPGIPGLPLALPGVAQPVAAGVPGVVPPAVPDSLSAVQRAAAFAASISLQANLAKFQKDAPPPAEHYEADFEINDFPQHARWKITHKETLNQINEFTGAAVTTRGVYCMPGKKPPLGEKKLYLFIEGPTEAAVKKAKTEIKRILEESSAVALSSQSHASHSQTGKYNVL